jgi:hypothetical protein
VPPAALPDRAGTLADSVVVALVISGKGMLPIGKWALAAIVP